MNGLRLNRNLIQSFAIVALLISVTVALPLTTIEVRALSVQTRGLTLALTALCVALLAASVRGNRVMLFSMCAFALLYLYGLVLATIMGDPSNAMSALPTTILVTSLGLFILSQSAQGVTRSNASILILYIIIFMLMTVVFGGLVLSMPPHFVFEVQTESYGSAVSYSQGVSRFFGLGLVLCGFLLQSERSAKLKALFLFLSALFLLLAFLGGGRGDALAALIVFLFIVMIRMPLKAKISTIVVMGLLIGLFIANVNLEDLVIFRRLRIIMQGSMGSRDKIYADAVALLADRFQCLAIGCGFDYYQYALQLTAGRYPHNQLLEAIIVWGIPLTGMVMVFSAIGLYKSLSEKVEEDALPYIALFHIIVAMKSGSVIWSWVFTISVFYYFGVGLDRALFPRRQ